MPSPLKSAAAMKTPPKKPGNMSEQAATNSAMPSEIMANGVPECLVVT